MSSETRGGHGAVERDLLLRGSVIGPRERLKERAEAREVSWGGAVVAVAVRMRGGGARDGLVRYHQRLARRST